MQACYPGQRELRLLTGTHQAEIVAGQARRAALMRDLLVSVFPGWNA